MEKIKLIIAQPCISGLILVFWGLVSTVAWTFIGFIALDIQNNFPIFTDDTGGGWTVFGIILIGFSCGAVLSIGVGCFIYALTGGIFKISLFVYATLRPPLFCVLALINSRPVDIINLGLETCVGTVFLILLIVYKSNSRLKREIQTIRQR